jgi:hypothetical protein
MISKTESDPIDPDTTEGPRSATLSLGHMRRTEEQLLSRLDEEPSSPASTEAETTPLLLGDLNVGENSSVERRPLSDLDHREIGELAELMKSFEKDGYLERTEEAADVEVPAFATSKDIFARLDLKLFVL